MNFCKNCNNILRVQVKNGERFLYCRVCNVRTKLNEEITVGTSNDTKDKGIIVVSEDEQSVFPVTNVLCPKCNEMREAEWTMQQMRGGDEPPTRFYQCKTCKWRWREYS